MVSAQAIIDTRIKALQRQVMNVKNLITQPTGVFETIDNMIKTARYANRETLRNLGVAGLAGQGIVVEKFGVVGAQGPVLKRIRQVIGNLKSRIGR